MGIRDSLSRYPAITIGVAGGLIVVSVVAIVLQARSAGAPSDMEARKSWFTTDDGKTWFADDAKKLPPFEKDGKVAYRAYVYRTPDGTEFVGFLERFTPSGKRAAEEALKTPAHEPPPGLGPDAMEVKKPGQPDWIKTTAPEAENVYRIVSPKGQSEGLTLVYPK